MERKPGDLLVFGAGTGSSSVSVQTGDGNDDNGGNSLLLSLGSIYNILPTTSCDPAVPGVMVPRRHCADASSSAAAAAIPAPAGGTAFFATGVLAQAQIASSPSTIFLDGNGAAAAAASPVRFSSLPIPSPLLFFAPSTAISLPARQAAAMQDAALAPINQDVKPPPAQPLPACTERRADGAPQAPVVGEGGSPPPASNDATGRHVSGPPAPRANDGAPQAAPVVIGGPEPPFPWATNREAFHYSIPELAARGITAIEGEVQCKKCDVRKTISLDLATKFEEVRSFIARNIHGMDDRAPPAWTNTTKLPALDCENCGQSKTLRPVIPPEKEKINWVFMLLGQTLGMLTLDQLKHFCAHTRQHRTGAKDRVLYSTYMALCSQLSPDDELFNVTAERKKRSRHYYSLG